MSRVADVTTTTLFAAHVADRLRETAYAEREALADVIFERLARIEALEEEAARYEGLTLEGAGMLEAAFLEDERGRALDPDESGDEGSPF